MIILYEDDALIVCVKPAGALSEKSEKPNMVSMIASHTGAEPYPVHRLDRETGGVMVYAKTKQAAAALSEQIRQGSFEKRYLAVVQGLFEEKSGEMTDLLFRDKLKNKTFVVDRERAGVKTARLEYAVLDDKNGFSLADVLLHTGRTHQIRAQFSSRKHPLYGDRKYGGCAGDLALFAYSLEFAHPVNGEKLKFEYLPDFSIPPWNMFEYKKN
ncbi:MAG: RluA family pseudouridine synthase [Clostridia bacterium]|nr:RluA family pseudouridine synthase [Clostridia bacterium]